MSSGSSTWSRVLAAGVFGAALAAPAVASPASAGPVAERGLGAVTFGADCAGGRLTVVTRPAEREGRVVVVARARGLRDGARFTVGFSGSDAAQQPVGSTAVRSVRARDGRFTLRATRPAAFYQTVSVLSGTRFRCNALVHRTEPAPRGISGRPAGVGRLAVDPRGASTASPVEFVTTAATPGSTWTVTFRRGKAGPRSVSAVADASGAVTASTGLRLSGRATVRVTARGPGTSPFHLALTRRW